MPTLGAALDFAKLEGRNLRAHQLGTAPSSPVTGQLYYNTADNTLYWWNGTTWIAASAGAGGPPTGAAGGDLTSTYPNPQIAAGVIVDADVNGSAAIAESKLALATDAAAGTGSRRTLGTGATQAMAGSTRLDTIAAPTASVNANSQRIISLADPTGAQDAATKAYVDSVAAGLDPKASCRAATTVTLTLATPGATIDGVTMAANDRVLVKNQSTGSQNGIYVWNGAAAVMTRAADANVSAEMTPGVFTFIEEGTTLGNTGWVLTTDAPITLDTTSLTFTQFSGPGEYVAGNGLTLTATTFDVGGTANRITVAADTVDISTAYVGQATITTLGTVTTGTWTGTTIAVANGGTGATNSVTARINLGFASYYSSATHGAGTTITILASTHLCRAQTGLIVQCQIDATGVVVIPDISVASNGDVTVTFGVSQSANTIRTTIIG